VLAAGGHGSLASPAEILEESAKNLAVGRSATMGRAFGLLGRRSGTIARIAWHDGDRAWWISHETQGQAAM
jgi:hypothetical protein